MKKNDIFKVKEFRETQMKRKWKNEVKEFHF